MHILSRYAITFENWFILATFDFQAVNIVPLSHYNQLALLYSHSCIQIKTLHPHPKKLELFIEETF